MTITSERPRIYETWVATCVEPVPQRATPDPFIGQCPSWCEHAGAHSIEDSADRHHESTDRVIPLSLETNRPTADPSDYVSDSLTVYLTQHYRAARPAIVISRHGMAGPELTVPEASILADGLIRLVGIGRVTGPRTFPEPAPMTLDQEPWEWQAVTTDPLVGSCPEWCVFGGQHDVVGERDEQEHLSAAWGLALSLGEIHSDPEGTKLWPTRILIYLEMPDLDAVPAVRLGVNSDLGFRLTLDEAQLLADALLEMASLVD